MTKLHKIDREKLAAVSRMGRIFMDADEFTLLRQAAENWLTITDPGFEVSEAMVDAGLTVDLAIEQDNYMATAFKAMIAKAGE